MTKQTEVHVHTCECAICQAGTNQGTIQQHQRINLFLSRLTEPQRRWYVGMLAEEPDSPSDIELARITGVDRKTIRRGRREVIAGLADLPHDRQRQPGGGRVAAKKRCVAHKRAAGGGCPAYGGRSDEPGQMAQVSAGRPAARPGRARS
jgi:hypothetical protein